MSHIDYDAIVTRQCTYVKERGKNVGRKLVSGLLIRFPSTPRTCVT
ncbi:MAG: hypothetical protein ABSF14_21685 [Terriglobia bacterium]